MKTPTIYTKYKRPEPSLEFNEGEILVETVGYRNTKTILNEMRIAGLQLEAARAEQYDFQGNKISWDYINPMKEKSFTIQDGLDFMYTKIDEIKAKRKEYLEELRKANIKTQEEFAEWQKSKQKTINTNLDSKNKNTENTGKSDKTE